MPTAPQAALLRCVPAADGKPEKVVEDEGEGAVRLAARLAPRRLLLVLDDCWSDAHARLFCGLPLAAEGGSLVLITTRIVGLLGSGAAPRCVLI